jgi:hypothetical protein
MSGEINVISRTQQIIVDPASSSVAVINAGPPGPASGAIRELLYSQIVADVTVTALSAAAAQSIINPGNVTYDGSPVILEFIAAGVRPAATLNAQILMNLYDGNTDMGYLAQVMTPAASTMIVPVRGMRRLTPSAGAHNYNIRAWVSAGSGIISATPPFSPAFVRVTKT